MRLQTPVTAMRGLIRASFLGGVCLMSGCYDDGLKLGRVSGIVTLDGQPVPNAFITFNPQFPGRPAMTKSNEKGAYELRFNSSRMGALVGEHHVTVSTEDQTVDGKVVPELIPKAYRGSNGFVPVTVKSGRNTINLELKSGKEKK